MSGFVVVRLGLEAFFDATAGPRASAMPESDLHVHFFVSADLDAERRYTSVPMPPRTDGDSQWHAFAADTQVTLRASRAVERYDASACVGMLLYARSSLAPPNVAERRRLPFQEEIAGNVLYLRDMRVGRLFDVALRQWCDRAGNDEDSHASLYKATLRVRVLELVDAPLVATTGESAATAENYERLQQYAQQRVSDHLHAYRRLGMRPATADCAQTHVIRFVTLPSGRQLSVVYFLRRYASHRNAWLPYLESAVRVVTRAQEIDDDTDTLSDLHLARLACHVATLYAQTAVTYVNDRSNRGRGRPLGDIEQMLDVLVTRKGDCEDVASLAYIILRTLYEFGGDDGGAVLSPLLRRIARVVRTQYVPMMVVGEAVDPDAPARASIDAHEQHRPNELICHVYCLLVPTAYAVASLSRALVRRGAAPLAALTMPRDAALFVCEGTTHQCPMPCAYETYAAGTDDVHEARARAAAALHAACRRASDVERWQVLMRVADAPPFYGRVVGMFSELLHPTMWIFGASRAQQYGVRMRDLAALADDIEFVPLVEQTPFDRAVADSVLAQCQPLIPPLAPPPAPSVREVSREVAALAARFPPPTAQRTHSLWVRQLRRLTAWWPISEGRALVPAEDIAAITALLDGPRPVYAGMRATVHAVCGGHPRECGDALAATPVLGLAVDFYVE
jgi:hypothetical protein